MLMSFYRTVNPWGFWGPVRDKVLRADPTFVPNRDAARDLSNVAVGIVWQTCLVLLPIYLVLRPAAWSIAIAAVLAGATVFLKAPLVRPASA